MSYSKLKKLIYKFELNKKIKNKNSHDLRSRFILNKNTYEHKPRFKHKHK